MSGYGVVPERRVMNVDQYRERCKVEGLEPGKLRRVSFRVDVEIAAPVRYSGEDRTPSPPILGRKTSLTMLEKEASVKKAKMQKERGEGAALKHPQAVAEEKDATGVVQASGENVGKSESKEEQHPDAPPKHDGSKKKEKKKRSEEERKERKEKKKRLAEANGTIPLELQKEDDESFSSGTSPGASTPRTQDRPTTDPLRIYKRCCQLRETSVLKRVTEQISSPSSTLDEAPGTVAVLELSGLSMQLPDIITLGDWLAVVPVRKLVMENCGLGDEAVRIVLAGLLSVKTNEQARHNRCLAKSQQGVLPHKEERLGVIEKLSLKDNPKITREGWKHVGLFLHMSRSLKGIDLSGIPFPKTRENAERGGNRNVTVEKPETGVSSIISRALGGRLGGDRLEELVLGECDLTPEDVGKIIDGAMQFGLKRLGLASNKLDQPALEHVMRFLRSGKCTGLDLGGNDMREHMRLLTDSLGPSSPLYALSLADCNLDASSLVSLFPAITKLPDFRFIDLSHNRNLFDSQPNALTVLRKYLPQLKNLKRIHLADVAMSSEHAISLAEILPEAPGLCHLNILENPKLEDLATAKDDASQEEACALYASLMAAVRVSTTIICIDVDVPGPESSEVVKALAKQVVAYSLRNMERGPWSETYAKAAASIAEPHGGEKQVSIPDILLHLVGHVEGFDENHDSDEPAPDDDYVIGGTGVVKALGVCLGTADSKGRRSSRIATPTDSGTATPTSSIPHAEQKKKAKEMSKNLLGSARKIRMRLRPALVREDRAGNDYNYRKFSIPRYTKALYLPLTRLFQVASNSSTQL